MSSPEVAQYQASKAEQLYLKEETIRIIPREELPKEAALDEDEDWYIDKSDFHFANEEEKAAEKNYYELTGLEFWYGSFMCDTYGLADEEPEDTSSEPLNDSWAWANSEL
ncbi:hypothetical protein [Shewanella saliphila]|uniref:Uncharacterized protein n=1 Tax=Shewanella saliphila TaxID=2282698 RepID=A0ABQ2QCJ7_9GAMM|nr:hypothetical protein [Shewanella saliphila]MCL1103347.1 hypothetical protein [Shewanella saliphila]GGP71830.1 hypothetical protein GCM10009409_39620 [Shewanella saliphila]